MDPVGRETAASWRMGGPPQATLNNSSTLFKRKELKYVSFYNNRSVVITVYIKTPFARILLINDATLYHLIPIVRNKRRLRF